MKLKCGALIILFFIFFLLIPKDNTIATVSMDGRGHYRLSNYTIKGSCIFFIDNMGNKNKFCGAFKVKTQEDYYRLWLSQLPFNF